MPFAGAIATCSILLLLRVPFAEGQSSRATSEAFMMEQILSENGCGAFAGLVAATAPAGEAFREQIAGDDGGAGLTIFCPDDEAVAAFGPGRFSNLTAGDQVALLLYHGVPTASLEEARRLFYREWQVATLARGLGGYGILTVRDGGGGAVTLSSPHNLARVTKLVVHNDRLVVYLIDSVLIPGEPTTLYDWDPLLALFCIFVGLAVLILPPLLGQKFG
ncbi:unnamed protein product [Alopecurus aequalis]